MITTQRFDGDRFKKNIEDFLSAICPEIEVSVGSTMQSRQWIDQKLSKETVLYPIRISITAKKLNPDKAVPVTIIKDSDTLNDENQYWNDAWVIQNKVYKDLNLWPPEHPSNEDPYWNLWPKRK